MKSPDVSSDVSIDSLSDDENGFCRKSRLSFDKMAAKGWSTCADGFDEDKQTPQSKSQLYSGNWASVSSSNILRAIQRKKERKKVYNKYSGLPCHRFRQFLKENIDIDPDFISENVPKRYSPIVIRCHVDNNRKLQVVPKMENAAKWVYSNFSESFCEASDVNGPPSNASIQRKRPVGDNFVDIDAKLDSMPSGEEVIEDNGSSDPCSLQNGLSDEIVAYSPSPQPLQEMTDLQKLIQCNEKNSKYSVVAPKMPFVQSRHLTISHNTVRSTDNSDTANTLQKGSDWLKSIAWHNNSVIESCDTDHDEEKVHSNKTQKFVPGGFAEQAAKVEKKTRHSRLVWSHQKRGKAASEKCLTVQLCPFRVMNGMMLSKCVIVKKPTSSANTSIAKLNMSTSPCNAISKQESANQDSNCERDMAENVVPLNDSIVNTSVLSREHCFLLLKPNVVRGLKLTVGSIIRIHPPWQSLDVPSLPYPVILCSYYIDTLDVSTSLENSSMQGVTENAVYESNDCCKNNDSGASSSNQKILKQQKRLNAVSQTKDIRKFFKEPQKDTVAAVDTNDDNSSISSQHHKSTCKETTLSSHSWDQSFLASFCISGETFSLCGRVQRIWKIPNTDYRLLQKSSATISPLTLNPRYSLIVQDKRSQFFMIHLLNFRSSPNSSWSDLLKRESKCFQFSAVKVTQILQPSRFPTLFTVLNHIKKTSEAQPQDQLVCQKFCYQLVVDCSRSFVTELPDNSCPSYCPYEVSSLDKMIEKDILSRFSCCAKVFCEVDDMLYITDKYLQKKHSSCSYVKISFWSRKVKPSLLSGSNILVAEAVVQKDGLFVDRYSTVTPLPQLKKEWNSGFLVSKLVPMDLFKDLDLFRLNSCTWPKLHPSARVGDLVTVKGIIYSVDEDTAVSWLECNLCGKENLYQDAECRVLCSLCNCIVEVPKLGMKMHVSVQVIEMLDASIIVELSCLTTKRILEIPDNVCQPKCNVTDVLHKKIGPLVCLIRSHENQNGEVKFKLQEIVLI